MKSKIKTWIQEDMKDPEFVKAYEFEMAKIEIANAIINARKKYNLKQTDLMKLTGIKQSEISKIETAQVYPNLSTLLKLLKALDLKLVAIDVNSQ